MNWLSFLLGAAVASESPARRAKRRDRVRGEYPDMDIEPDDSDDGDDSGDDFGSDE